MDTPFPGEKSPFLVPYPAPAPADQGIKPFTAVDLAPPSGQSGPRMQAPQASPFLEKDFGKDAPAKAPPARTSPPQSSMPDPLRPIPAGSLSQVFAPSALGSPQGFPFAAAPAMPPKPANPAPAPMGLDFTAVPAARPAPADFVPVPAAPILPAASAAAPPISAIPMAVPAPKPASAPAPKPAPAAKPAPSAAAPALAPIPAPVPGPQAPVDARASTSLRASAILRRGSASEMIAKTDLAMTDADAPEPTPLIVTSGPSVEGRRISAYLGLVSSEIVIPMDVLFRNPAPYGELHRIKAAEDELQRVKRKAFQELEARGRALGADGIIAVTMQYSQIDAVAFLCAAAGTAVKLNLGP
jgi:uncharacterized protein YbjQ (UPF0145 family)